MGQWFLLPEERGNPATSLDTRHADRRAWSTGNEVRPLVHGATYFSELLDRVTALRRGDLLLFTDWRGDPDERLSGPGTEIGQVFGDAAQRGVIVKGLVWRSHWNRLRFSEQENRHLGEDIEAAGGECLLDMRVRAGGSHHQKCVVLRHPDRPERDICFVGGIDLCHSRRDDRHHHGDPQPQPMAAAYGERPPWHDVQLAMRGPVVGDVEAVFRERWEDPSPLSRHPVYRLGELIHHEDTHAERLPPQLPDPPACGAHAVQLLRTYPYRRRGYPFAPQGERSVARGYTKALRNARSLIYLEDQYLWSTDVVAPFAAALSANPDLHLMAVVPHVPEQDGRLVLPPHLLGRLRALAELRRVGGDRVAVYGVENHEGTPVYVHAKACVIDDVWAAVGSDNINLRSWTHDSELGCAVLDEAHVFARELRLTLAREHLDRADGDDADLVDPRGAYEAFARAAAALQAWYDGGCNGPRPPGRLRPYRPPDLPIWNRLWAGPLYRWVYDQDGRPPSLRRAGTF